MADCDFEKDTCNWAIDDALNLKWAISHGEEIDHTTGTDEGQFIKVDFSSGNFPSFLTYVANVNLYKHEK